MPTIRAVVVDPSAAAHLTIGAVEAPVPAANEALVRVKAISLNRGETRGAQTAAAGSRPGWDIAGLIEKPAADGSGPRTGRVVGLLRTGAWAELVAVPTTNLATLPDSVRFADAATLPVAGLTALYALDRGNGITARNVLVTGASGGVGIFGVQIARYGGARVTGLVRQERHVQVVKDAGAHNVVADETGEGAKAHGPFNLVLEAVGGPVLSNAVGMLATYGQMVCYGGSAGGASSVDSGMLLRSRAEVTGLGVFVEMNRETASVGLGRLLRMMEAGAVKPVVAVEAPWTEIGNVAQQLLDRSYPGKAVLTVS